MSPDTPPDLRTDTRRRMIAGAARAIGTKGVGAMSLRDLAREAGVPLGSTYHHFPGGSLSWPRKPCSPPAARSPASSTPPVSTGRRRR